MNDINKLNDGAVEIDGRGKVANPSNETSHTRPPHHNPLPLAGEEANESLRECHDEDEDQAEPVYG